MHMQIIQKNSRRPPKAYADDPEKFKEAFKKAYAANSETIKETSKKA